MGSKYQAGYYVAVESGGETVIAHYDGYSVFDDGGFFKEGDAAFLMHDCSLAFAPKEVLGGPFTPQDVIDWHGAFS